MKELVEWIDNNGSFSTKVTVDENGKLKMETVYRGETNKSLIFDKLKKVKDGLKSYVNIFRDDNSNDAQQVKDKGQQDFGYYTKLLEFEQGIVDLVYWTQEFFGGNGVAGTWRKFELAWEKIKNNPLWTELKDMYTLTGTGIPTNRIASGIASTTVKNAFLYGSTIIGSFFGPLGTIAGGAIGGMLGALFSYPIS
jgi:hypothetical protein